MKVKTQQLIDRSLGNVLIGINLFAARILGMVLKRNHSIQHPPNTILIIKILGLGSLMLAADIIAALRIKYPNAKLILLTSAKVAPGIKPLKLFDEIWSLEDQKINSLIISLTQYLFKSWKLKNLWVLDLEVYSKLTTLYSLWTCAINRFGFQLNVVNFRNRINTHNVFFNSFLPVEENYAQLAYCMGVENIVPSGFPAFPRSERIKEKEKDYLLINNTCSDLALTRKLTTDQYTAIINELLEIYPWKIALSGAISDFEENESVIKSFSNSQQARLRNISGEFDLPEFYDFIYHHCVMVISIDSSPVHIARKLGVPFVSIWGPVNPWQMIRKESLIPEREKVIYNALHCSPCVHLSISPPCNGNNICIKEIDQKQILNSVAEIIPALHS